MSFRKILCPVDLSAPSAEAARYASALASQRAGELTLLHVAHPLDFDFAMVAPAASRIAEVATQRNQAIRQALDLFPGDPGLAISAKRMVVEGEPAEQIVRVAKEGGYDLILMSTHGTGAVKRWLMVGSVTTKVLNTAECSVMAGVDFGGRFDHHAVRRIIRKLVVAIDMGPESQRVLCTAAGMAKEYGASITVVHAAPTFGEHAQDFVDEGWRATLSGQLQGKLTEMLKDVGAEGDVLVESGSAAEIVAKTATRTQADMVLIGRSTHRGLIGRLKAQAYEIIRHCPCPVLSV